MLGSSFPTVRERVCRTRKRAALYTICTRAAVTARARSLVAFSVEGETVAVRTEGTNIGRARTPRSFRARGPCRAHLRHLTCEAPHAHNNSSSHSAPGERTQQQTFSTSSAAAATMGACKAPLTINSSRACKALLACTRALNSRPSITKDVTCSSANVCAYVCSFFARVVQFLIPRATFEK